MVCDIKLSQILTGISPSSSSIHPCYVCEWDRRETWTNAPYRTFESCQNNYTKFKESSSKPKCAQHFKNCINCVLVHGNPSEFLVDKLVLPELHIMEGTVNHVMENM